MDLAQAWMHDSTRIQSLDDKSASVEWIAPATPWQPWSTPFALSASWGKIWIAPQYKLPLPAGAAWEDTWSVLKLKGTNWAGFQSSYACVHEMWKHDVDEYIDYLVSNEFNAVRLPLNARVITWAMRKEAGNGYPYVVGERCGQYNGWESLKILDDVIGRLRDVGIFVMCALP